MECKLSRESPAYWPSLHRFYWFMSIWLFDHIRLIALSCFLSVYIRSFSIGYCWVLSIFNEVSIRFRILRCSILLCNLVVGVSWEASGAHPRPAPDRRYWRDDSFSLSPFSYTLFPYPSLFFILPTILLGCFSLSLRAWFYIFILCFYTDFVLILHLICCLCGYVIVLRFTSVLCLW